MLELNGWVIGLAILVFAALIGVQQVVPDENGAVRAVLIAAVIAWALLLGYLVTRLLARLRGGRSIRSVWIVFIATAMVLVPVAIANPITAGSTAPVSPPASVETYLAIASPFSLTATTAEEKASFDSMSAAANGNTEARRVIEEGELVGYLVVIDADATDPDHGLRRFETGIESNSGVEAHRGTVSGHDVLIASGTASGMVIMAWIERPYLMLVYGTDEASARLLAESVMASYE